MFNLQSEVQRLKQLDYAKVHGLPHKPKQKDPQIQHIDDTPYDIQAEQEGIALSRRFKSRTYHFGVRISKAKGHRHRVPYWA